MKAIFRFGLIGLLWPIMLAACNPNDVTPRISNLIGKYECAFEQSNTAVGGVNWTGTTSRFEIVQSPKGGDLLDLYVQYGVNSQYDEKWEISYSNGRINVPKQVTRDYLTSNLMVSRPWYEYREGSGTAFGDSIR